MPHDIISLELSGNFVYRVSVTPLLLPLHHSVFLSSHSDYEIRCRPAHGFHHVLSMTANMSDFTRVIKRQRISGNMDTPEGGLDAMLQAAVCQVGACRALFFLPYCLGYIVVFVFMI